MVLRVSVDPYAKKPSHSQLYAQVIHHPLHRQSEQMGYWNWAETRFTISLEIPRFWIFFCSKRERKWNSCPRHYWRSIKVFYFDKIKTLMSDFNLIKLKKCFIYLKIINFVVKSRFKMKNQNAPSWNVVDMLRLTFWNYIFSKSELFSKHLEFDKNGIFPQNSGGMKNIQASLLTSLIVPVSIRTLSCQTHHSQMASSSHKRWPRGLCRLLRRPPAPGTRFL